MIQFLECCTLYVLATLLRLTLNFEVFLNSGGKDTGKETGRRTLRSSKRGGNGETDCLGKNSSACNTFVSSGSSHNASVTTCDIRPCILKCCDFRILVLCTVLC